LEDHQLGGRRENEKVIGAVSQYSRINEENGKLGQSYIVKREQKPIQSWECSDSKVGR
jgi:hypothetical protein